MKFKSFIPLTLSLSALLTLNSLTIHAFPHEDKTLTGSDARKSMGSNYWVSSNLREWLNSDSKTVRYTQLPPDAKGVKAYPYADEAGFLTGFTEVEKNAIAITERGSLVGAEDKTATTNGKTSNVQNNHNDTISINFDFPNFLKNYAKYGQVVVNEKVFILNYKELAEYVQHRGWSIYKKPSTSAGKKYNKSASANLAYYVHNPVQDIGSEYLKIVSADEKKTSTTSYPNRAEGLAPALHLKPDASVKRLKSYNINSIDPSWTITNDTVKAHQLNIGDIVEFGSHLGERIQWRVINISAEGYPLLFSENIIDLKAFDAKGDYSQRFSYLDLEDVFPNADVSMSNFHLTNIQKSTDISAPSIIVTNENDLFERQNGSFNISFKVSDPSGIAYIKYPDETKISLNNVKEYTFNYKVNQNGYYTFGVMDSKGNFKYFVIPVGNINLAPSVNVIPSTTSWTNQNVTVAISATNDVGWSANSVSLSTRSHYDDSWGNYTTYTGKRIRITGKVQYISDKNDFDPSKWTYAAGFKYKQFEKNGDDYILSYTWPYAFSDKLSNLKQETFNNQGFKEVDITYTIPNNYFSDLQSRLSVGVNVQQEGDFLIRWTDLKYELLDNDDFAITKIELPDGTYKTVKTYTDTISKEGINTLSYKVHDNRGMITTKTVTSKIDKTKPTLNVSETHDQSPGEIQLKIQANDTLSGVKQITLPNGSVVYGATANYTVPSSGSYTFKVADYAGNVLTKTVQVTGPTLTAQAKPTENMIRLDWTALKDHTYQVYQKKEGSNDFQSISMTDLDTTHKVKVLNIYPINDHSSNQVIPMDTTFETWDGEILTLPKSARLKRWMEEPNAEHEKGYGQGLIEVNPIPIDQFNSNYSTILKNSDGSWKYDVIMIGTWDGRGNTNPTLNSNAVNLIGEFIDSGRGVLAGHDTIGYTQGSQSGLGIIREKFNIKVGNWKGNGTPDTNHNYFSAFTSTNVILKKKGLLSNYPWDLGEEGAVFTIPLTHTSANFAYGDIWMDLHNASPYDDVDPQKPYTPEHLMPYSLFYLTTWNNTAMIQTGHSNGEATPDEQKILANTLFYLNQLSENKYLNDHSGQDVKAPSSPTLATSNVLSDNSLELTFGTFKDHGSTYEYYLKATHKDGNSSKTSNTVKETITSGVKGVSYVIDTNPDTEPDNTVDPLNQNKLIIKPNSEKTTYLHIKTVDYVGNVSKTEHFSFPVPKINIAEQQNEKIYLNWDIEIPDENIFFKSDFEDIDLDLPNGNLINGINLGSFAGYKVDKNGNPRPNNDTVRNGVKIISGVGYSNSKGVVATTTRPNNGWDYHYYSHVNPEENQSNHSSFFFGWQQLKTEKPAIIRFKTKGDGTLSLGVNPGWWTGGSAPHASITYAENLSVEELKHRFYNNIPIKINNPQNISLSSQLIATAVDKKFEYNFFTAMCNIEKQNGQWVIQPIYGNITAWRDQVRPGQVVTPESERTIVPVKVGDPIALPTYLGGANAITSPKASSNWTNYSFNINIPHSQAIIDLNSYFQIEVSVETATQLFLDDLTIAYAPKSRLYRDGKLLVEDYTVEYNDTTVKDTAAPEAPAVFTDYENNQLKLTWDPVKDKGTDYTYQVSSVNELNFESVRSSSKTVTFTRGLKEYRIYLNGHLIKTTTELSHTFDQEIIASDRIEVGAVDHAGNESRSTVNLLNLTAQAKPSENMIRLDWTNVNNATYQVYQKKEGRDDFQTIGTMDFNATTVRVLNVYPYISKKTISFTSWDGSSHSLPQSAILKQWMEEPNAEHSKGYGKGLITVDTVSISDFNDNPDYYLKNGTSEYQYDVIVFGISDSWGDSEPALEAAAELAVDRFLTTGRGVLFGHDTAYRMRSGTLSRVESFTRLAEKYLDVQLNGLPASELVLDNFYNGNNPSLSVSYTGTSTVEITKKGFLTNFPWSIGEVGTLLTTPYTHTAFQQTGKGDIWMRFNWENKGMDHPMNSYLYTHNNTALVQTGHSIANKSNSSTIATPDEQKVLANTLFYLKQLSSVNFLDDYSGQDVKAPLSPRATSTSINDDQSITITFDTFEDQGSTYDYYVKATHKNGNSSITSNTVTETITSGVAGVSYVVDTNPETIPDNQLDTLSNYQIKLIPNSEKTTYLHIKVIDQAGNASETLHIPITTPPTLKSEVINNEYIRLDWTTPLLPENILWSSSFEPDDDRPMINYFGNPGNQRLDSSTSFSGTSSLKIGDALKGKPNFFDNGKGVFVDVTQFDRVKKVFKNQMPVSIQLKGKASKPNTNAFITLLIAGGREFKLTDFGITATEFTPAGSTKIKINNPNSVNFNPPYDLIDLSNKDSYNWAGDLSTGINYIDINPLMHLTSGVTSDGYLHLRSPLTKDVQAGQSIKVRRWVDPIEEFKKPIPSTEWETIQYNTTITDMTYLDMFTLGCFFNIKTFTEGQDIYLDDLSISTPVKVKLYRNNQLIYEGLDNHLDDINATDKTAPNPIDLKTIRWNVKATSNNISQFNIQFNAPNDLGSNYTYQISSINSYGVESLKSAPVSETVTSGVKGYSYLIDSNPTSEPDNTVDLKTNQTQISYTGQAGQYLHIKVIDHEGNSSETQHIKLESLTLTAEAKPSENMIRLDWTDLNENTYQVYQKKEGRDDFQSISMTDLSDSKQVQVLNIYPYRATDTALTTITFSTWDGERMTLPKSAALKMWMEQPVSGFPKGYGMGQIEVTPVSQPEFNLNPEKYLKNPDGTWKYDVVANGFWDVNANNDYTANALELIKQFIEDGKGYLAGHDTLGADDLFNGRLSHELRSYLNIKYPEDIGVSHKGLNPAQGTRVKLLKRGLLTNYPHNIGSPGVILTTPTSHSLNQIAYGDIWLNYTEHTGNTFSDGGTTNHYLTTWYNTAMIQTGHSIGEATPDEQKILANTLFYLNQLSANNYLNDYSGQDVKAPEKPSVIKTNILSSGFIELKFKDFEDNGSTYEYYVKATHKGGSSQISNTVTETITTGVAGVSYIVDTKPNTIPDNTIDTLNNQTLQIKPNTSQTTYLHIKTIDGAGNSSKTLHYNLQFIELTATPKPLENNNHGMVRLDWTPLKDHTYQVYQKKEGSEEFQSVSMTDLSKSPQVKVLNLYPTSESWHHIPMDTAYTTWDGEQVPSLPKSAQLKRWMEEPNAEHPKGYGMGYIKVTPVSFQEYDQNPIAVLKNADGSWKYDVIYYGHWDALRVQISDNSIDLLGEFIDSGQGFLAGHDTLGFNLGTNRGLNRIRDRFNIKVGYWEKEQIGDEPTDPGHDFSMGVAGEKIQVKRKGLLTNFPWAIGDVGNVLTVPLTHTTANYAYGDIWMTFTDYRGWGYSPWQPHLDHVVNHYLTSWNNTAMIQTGHSNGEATPDEQKVLANTLFYLNQLSSTNYLNDYSGQDVKTPETPLIKTHNYTTTNQIVLDFDAAQDRGSTYEYYVKGSHKDGSGTILSNTASATVTSGIKGYSWMADSNPDTIPDDIIEQTTNSSIKIPTNNNGPYYLHIKAIDKAGNVSETHHYELTDTSKPSLTLTQNPTTWTNGDVIITASASDSGTVASGVKEIILPDGNKVSGSTATFTAIQNGTYTFTAVDFMGNQQSASITISNIDKVKPTGAIVIDKNQDEFYDEETEIHINMSDILDGQEKLSGIAKAEIFDVNGTYTYTMTNPTQYTQTLPWVLAPYELPDGTLKAQVGMKLTDRAGNVTTVYSKEVAVIKVRVEEFHLTDVVNPAVYNKNNPFNRLSYPNIPSQELVLGGSFEFEAIYSYPPTVTSSWTATYKATIYYIHPTEGTQSFPIELVRQSVDGTFKTRHTIPFSVKKGAQVYLDLGVKVFNTSGKLMGEDTFPDPAGTRLKIGEITGDIREQIQFNEIY